MGSGGLEPGIAPQIKETADAVHNDPHRYAPVCSILQSGQYVFAPVVGIKIKSGQDDLFLGLFDHTQPVGQGFLVVVNICGTLCSSGI